MKVLANVPLSRYSGYGQDGIGLVQALVRAGVDVRLRPAHVDAPLPEDVCRVLMRPLEPPFDLALVHVDPGSMDVSNATRANSKLIVGWTMWEYTSVSNMDRSARKTLRRRTRHLDLLLCYDEVSRAALEPRVDCPVAVLQGGFDPALWKPQRRDWGSDRFGFCMVGALSPRKDPFVAIQAFQSLKDDPGVEFDGAELHLKTNVAGLHPAMAEHIPKMRVHYAVWPMDVLVKFYAANHVLLAPSRGEGKNVPALEFMSTGGTAIATNWGGHVQWMNPSYAYPLDYIERPVDEGHPDCLQARASVEHLRDLMLHTYRNRDEARAKGDLAASVIPEMCSWDAVVERLFMNIGGWCGDLGRSVQALAAACRPREVDREPVLRWV